MENRTLALMIWCCTLFLFIYFEFSDGKQNSVPNVSQNIFSNISVQGGVVDPNIHGFFDGPSHAVPHPAYNFEVLSLLFFGHYYSDVHKLEMMFSNVLQIFHQTF